mmetsp:Transcript_26115/g.37460  ORF Transcript_26115/g.37460 Transcript_26115/m.37460 type:complete len:87 (-) Transcript_26115:1894-2154(-)
MAAEISVKVRGAAEAEEVGAKKAMEMVVDMVLVEEEVDTVEDILGVTEVVVASVAEEKMPGNIKISIPFCLIYPKEFDIIFLFLKV